MTIVNLQINALRNLSHVAVELSPYFNVLFGQNGSGKTSLLEAVHYLGVGRSFRTHLSNRIIQEKQESLAVTAQLVHNGITFPMGIERLQNGETRMKIRGKNTTSIAELAENLPLQFINSEAHRLLTDGPKYRRQFLDWGLFHVEHSFYLVWQRISKIIKQRNAALRFAPKEQILLWNQELVSAAEEIHQLRAHYIEIFEPLFRSIIKNWLPHPIKLSYYLGWSAKRSLSECLESSLEQDRQLGYTQYGPHRADIILSIDNIPAQDRLSQGQQKLVVYALRLAQGMLLQQQVDKRCIFLIDDLPAELDIVNREFVANFLKELNTQVFITGIEKEDFQSLLALDQTQLFHVEHGKVEEENFTKLTI